MSSNEATSISTPHPVLYSYRRCPYAMRARMGLILAGIQTEQREIVFWDKPQSMLEASDKGTVPVLVLPDGTVIDESRDILFWALEQSDPNVLLPQAERDKKLTEALIDMNDGEFKENLDRYKYPDSKDPEVIQAARQAGEKFLTDLEARLSQCPHLLGAELTVLDIALFPFVRQFAHVDKDWWHTSGYENLQAWLAELTESATFKAIMKNRPTWEEGMFPLWVDEPEFDRRDQMRHAAVHGRD